MLHMNKNDSSCTNEFLHSVKFYASRKINNEMAGFALTEYEIACDFESSLSELTGNSKPHINMLTMLAEENQRYAEKIVQIIEGRIFRVSLSYKLPMVYLLDSIVKNCRKTQYKAFFSKNLPDVFAHVYHLGDDMIRQSLRKLRNTWHSVFDEPVLLELDKRMKEISTPMNQPDDNGKFSGKSVVKIEPEDEDVKLSIEDFRSVQIPASSFSTGNHMIWPPPTVLAPPVPQFFHFPPFPFHGNPATSNGQIKLECPPPPINSCNGPPAFGPPLWHPLVAPPPPPFFPFPPPVPPPVPPPSLAVSASMFSPATLPTSTNFASCVLSPIETTTPELFMSTDLTASSVSLPATSRTPIPPTPSSGASTPAPLGVDSPSDSSSTTLSAKLDGVQEGGAEPTPKLTPPPRTKHSSLDVVPVSTPPTPAATPAIQTTSTAANYNKIFVDGRAYEVRFLGETAVIERNGLPHTVSFVGKPKDVVIDGVPHKVPFGGDSAVVSVDGRPLRLRFGAPSRELYVGRVALRGAFGGAPIVATLNGVRHRFQLCGPPPEVRIDAEPAYELLRFMRAGPLGKNPAAVLLYKAPPAVPPTPLLPSSSTPPVLPSTASMPLGPSMTSLSLIAPTSDQSTTEKEIKLEKRNCPLTTLADFNINLLRIKYISVVESLYNDKKLQCDTCGLRFFADDRAAYSSHMTWHFRANVKSEIGCHAVSGGPSWWISSEQAWLDYSDEQLATSKANEIADTGFAVESQEDAESGGGFENPELSCAVCCDRFEQFWDEEDEAWKWNNAIFIDGLAYHSVCYEDHSGTMGQMDSEPCTSTSIPNAMTHSMTSPTRFGFSRVKKEEQNVDQSSDDDELMDCDHLPASFLAQASTSSVKFEPPAENLNTAAQSWNFWDRNFTGSTQNPDISNQNLSDAPTAQTTHFGGSQQRLLDHVLSAIQNVPTSLLTSLCAGGGVEQQPIIPGLSIFQQTSQLDDLREVKIEPQCDLSKVKEERVD